MSSSLSGGMGPAGSNMNANAAGKKMRGVDPSMKHISGHHRFQQFTPEQMQLFQGLFGNVGPDSFLSKLAGGDEEMFAQMEAPAMRQFAQLQGQNASRFSGAGMGARRGSGFQNYQGQQTADFAQDLQSKRLGLQRQAIMDLMGLSTNLMQQQPYGLSETHNQPSFMDRWLGLAANTMGVAARGNMSNPNAGMGFTG